MAENIKNMLRNLDKETLMLKIKDSVGIIQDYAKARDLQTLEILDWIPCVISLMKSDNS